MNDNTPDVFVDENGNYDYDRMVLMDVYEIIVNGNPWPKGFTKRRKLLFLDKLIAFLEDIEEFEKCKDIRKIKESVIHEIQRNGKKSGK